jgi:hypothetical protein
MKNCMIAGFARVLGDAVNFRQSELRFGHPIIWIQLLLFAVAFLRPTDLRKGPETWVGVSRFQEDVMATVGEAEWSFPLFFSNRNARWLDFARRDSMMYGDTPIAESL